MGFFDNYFSSIVTAKFLYSKKFYVVATARSGRKHLPDKVRKPNKHFNSNSDSESIISLQLDNNSENEGVNLGRGESITFQSSRLSNLTCTVWKDTKEVRFISTLNWPDIVTKCLHRVGSRKIEVKTPSCAASYSKFYGGVDHYDWHCSHRVYGALGHGSNKVWKHLMWHFTNMAVANAWILFSETSTRPKSKYYDHMSFRHELATQLIGGFTSRKRSLSVKPNLDCTVLDNMSGHEFIRMPVKRAKRCVAHCKYQPNKPKIKETVFWLLSVQQSFLWGLLSLITLFTVTY